MTAELTLSVPGGVWQRVREARGRVAELASGVSEEIRTAAVMVTAELLENAIKYGEAVAGCEDVVVHVTIDPSQVSIEVINGASSRDQVAEPLYISRLEQMLESPGVSGKLGLYRIGFEGNFDLSCRYEFPVLTVRATRVIGA
jgi:anti-sigma regulatory factor (Ser/Thr protein kinase)